MRLNNKHTPLPIFDPKPPLKASVYPEPSDNAGSLTDDQAVRKIGTRSSVGSKLLWTSFLVAIVFTVQYLQWTVVGKMSIDGVQGRYFIPFAPLLLLLFSNTRFCLSFDDHTLARRMLVGFILLANGVSAAMLLIRYYPLSL